MRRLVTLVALIAFPLAAAGQPTGRVDNARTLQRACAPVARSIETRRRRIGVPLEAGLVCLGYMQAMQDIAVLTDADGRSVLGACPSRQTRLSDLIRAFVDYADKHPRELGESAAVAVIKSFRRRFPCRTSNAPAVEPRSKDAAERLGKPKPR